MAGHGRIEAAKRLGIEDVPCRVISHLSEEQKKAYIIADNQLALNAGWDLGLLKDELEDLKLADFDIDLLGFDDGFLSSLFLDIEHGETNPYDEWDGMPEFDQQDEKPFRSIIVHFENSAMVDDFMRRMEQTVTDKTKYIYHPKKHKNDLKSQCYE